VSNTPAIYTIAQLLLAMEGSWGNPNVQGRVETSATTAPDYDYVLMRRRRERINKLKYGDSGQPDKYKQLNCRVDRRIKKAKAYRKRNNLPDLTNDECIQFIVEEAEKLGLQCPVQDSL
jgi:hypothetical protein